MEQVLEKNWRFGHYEIDLIAFDPIKKEIVAVEVKTRRNSLFQNPEEAVSLSKQNRLIEAFNSYIMEKEIDFEARFDIVAITSDKGKDKVNYIQDAFSCQ